MKFNRISPNEIEVMCEKGDTLGYILHGPDLTKSGFDPTGEELNENELFAIWTQLRNLRLTGRLLEK